MTDEEALARNLYACCEHCEHFGDDESCPDNHREPCPDGCND